MRIIFFSTLAIIFLLNTFNVEAKTIYYVTQNGTGNGSSWANAAGSIQTMIDKAVSGDEVWVAKGTYYPITETIARDARSRTFLLKNGVNIYGGFIGSEAAVTQRSLTDLDGNGKVDPFEFSNATLLSGDIDGVADVWTKKFNADGITWNWTVTGNEVNCYRVVTGGSNTILDGFSVEGGNANYAQYNSGAGIYSTSSVTNCNVYNCSTTLSGGGIYSSSVTNCMVSNCSAAIGGGGIYSSSSLSSSVTNCTVSNCSAGSGGGGGIYSSSSSPSSSVTNCTVSNCSAGSGGGIYSYSSVTNCIVSNCSSGSDGGGINSFYYSVTNCTVSNCSSGSSGGGIYTNSSSTLSVTNCSVNNCSAASGGGGGIYSSAFYSYVMYCSASNNKIGNTISNIWGYSLSDNIAPDVKVAYMKPTSFVGVATSEAQKNELLIANWRLREGSPCINNGLTGLSGNDIDNNPRIQYGDIDIGAYEFKISSISLPVIEDFDSWNDFNESSILYGSAKLNTRNDIKWTVENKKAVFSWKTNLIGSYSQQFFTYEINAIKATKVILRYDMYFEPYSGTISPLGTEKLSVEYSTDFVTWNTIANYSNQNGTMPNKTYLHDISNQMAGKTFFLRFNANGQNINRIEKWELDNIIVDTDGKATDVKQIKGASFLYSVNNGVLDIQNLKETTTVQLFDVNGKLLNDCKPESNSIQFALPTHGVYIVRTKSASGMESKKVVW